MNTLESVPSTLVSPVAAISPVQPESASSPSGKETTAQAIVSAPDPVGPLVESRPFLALDAVEIAFAVSHFVGAIVRPNAYARLATTETLDGPSRLNLLA